MRQDSNSDFSFHVLSVAAGKGSSINKVLMKIVENGAEINAKDSKGNTAVMKAFENGFSQTVPQRTS